MNSVEDILNELEGIGNPNTKKVLVKHGAQEPFFGVKVGDLKKIVKRVKKNHELSLQLYASGNSDAMYLAGLLADESMISKKELDDWANKAYWYMLSEYTVAWIAADSPHGHDMAKKWMESPKEMVQAAGWSTLSNFLGTTDDTELDLVYLRERLDYVAENIHHSENRVRYTMNGFVIAAGGFVTPLTNYARDVAKKIGKVSVDMGGTACKVPMADDYIQKMIDMGKVGRKKKMARC